MVAGTSEHARCARHPYPLRREERNWVKRGEQPVRIKNRHWANLRAVVLQRDVVCKRCYRANATEVDHVIARADGGTDALPNLQGVCKRCHASKTAAEAAARRRERIRARRREKEITGVGGHEKSE